MRCEWTTDDGRCAKGGCVCAALAGDFGDVRFQPMCDGFLPDCQERIGGMSKQASWESVRDKGRAIYAAGGVEIHEETPEQIMAYVMSGVVEGEYPVTDGGPYEVILSKRSWENSGNVGGWVQGFLCDCKWGFYHSGHPGAGWQGRFCSHAYATLLAANARARSDFFGDRTASHDPFVWFHVKGDEMNREIVGYDIGEYLRNLNDPYAWKGIGSSVRDYPDGGYAEVDKVNNDNDRWDFEWFSYDSNGYLLGWGIANKPETAKELCDSYHVKSASKKVADVLMPDIYYDDGAIVLDDEGVMLDDLYIDQYDELDAEDWAVGTLEAYDLDFDEDEVRGIVKDIYDTYGVRDIDFSGVHDAFDNVYGDGFSKGFFGASMAGGGSRPARAHTWRGSSAKKHSSYVSEQSIRGFLESARDNHLHHAQIWFDDLGNEVDSPYIGDDWDVEIRGDANGRYCYISCSDMGWDGLISCGWGAEIFNAGQYVEEAGHGFCNSSDVDEILSELNAWTATMGFYIRSASAARGVIGASKAASYVLVDPDTDESYEIVQNSFGEYEVIDEDGYTRVFGEDEVRGRGLKKMRGLDYIDYMKGKYGSKAGRVAVAPRHADIMEWIDDLELSDFDTTPTRGEDSYELHRGDVSLYITCVSYGLWMPQLSWPGDPNIGLMKSDEYFDNPYDALEELVDMVYSAYVKYGSRHASRLAWRDWHVSPDETHASNKWTDSDWVDYYGYAEDTGHWEITMGGSGMVLVEGDANGLWSAIAECDAHARKSGYTAGRRLEYEDDVVVVRNPDGGVDYKGIFDHCPYKEDFDNGDWMFDGEKYEDRDHPGYTLEVVALKTAGDSCRVDIYGTDAYLVAEWNAITLYRADGSSARFDDAYAGSEYKMTGNVMRELWWGGSDEEFEELQENVWNAVNDCFEWEREAYFMWEDEVYSSRRTAAHAGYDWRYDADGYYRLLSEFDDLREGQWIDIDGDWVTLVDTKLVVLSYDFDENSWSISAYDEGSNVDYPLFSEYPPTHFATSSDAIDWANDNINWIGGFRIPKLSSRKTSSDWQLYEENITPELRHDVLDPEEIIDMYGAYTDESYRKVEDGMLGVVSHHVGMVDDWWTWDTYAGYYSFGIDCGTCHSLEEGKEMCERSFANPGFTVGASKTASVGYDMFGRELRIGDFVYDNAGDIPFRIKDVDGFGTVELELVDFSDLKRYVDKEELETCYVLEPVGDSKNASSKTATRKFTYAEMKELEDEIEGRELHNYDRFKDGGLSYNGGF